ncbi:MAG: ribokinase, partial [Clostridia bacterium]|nr:ribokinase [Clostridia bacterium]
GQTLLGEYFKIGAGGKGSNQAVAAHRAGADVTLVTKIGNDVFGNVALDFYNKCGMNTDYVMTDNEVQTGAALIMVDELSAQNQISVFSGACGHILDEDVEKCRKLIESAGIMLVQLEVNFSALFKAIDIAHAAGVKIVLNTAPASPLPDEVLSKIDIVTPNESEAEMLTGVCVTDLESAKKAARVFLDKGVKQVVITMGSLGAFATDGEKCELIPRIPVNAIDTTGAGDAFNGGFVTALGEGKDLFEALRFGNCTGALSVTKLGTAPSMPDRKEIDELYDEYYREEK